VGERQRLLELNGGSALDQMSAAENIRFNIQAMRNAGAPEPTVLEVGAAARRFARSIGAL
jgi:hypothetical protein